jgi:hypothetical protein
MSRDEWEQVENTPNLYRRRHQGIDGDWSTRYYGRFVDWQGIRRRFALGKDLEKARRKLAALLTRNDGEFDFAKERRQRNAAKLTLSVWADLCLEAQKSRIRQPGEPKQKDDKKIAPSTHRRDLQLIVPLKEFFGSRPLQDISTASVDGKGGYKEWRSKQFIIRNRKPSSKRVSQSEIASELSLLRKLLRQAADQEKIAKAPKIDVPKKGERNRVLKEWEYKALLANSEPWFKRLQVFAYETCVGEGDLIRLTDDMIDEWDGEIVPQNGRIKTAVEQIAPLTKAARDVLAEARAERSKVKNLRGLVFTRDGKPISKDMIESA